MPDHWKEVHSVITIFWFVFAPQFGLVANGQVYKEDFYDKHFWITSNNSMVFKHPITKERWRDILNLSSNKLLYNLVKLIKCEYIEGEGDEKMLNPNYNNYDLVKLDLELVPKPSNGGKSSSTTSNIPMPISWSKRRYNVDSKRQFLEETSLAVIKPNEQRITTHWKTTRIRLFFYELHTWLLPILDYIPQLGKIDKMIVFDENGVIIKIHTGWLSGIAFLGLGAKLLCQNVEHYHMDVILKYRESYNFAVITKLIFYDKRKNIMGEIRGIDWTETSMNRVWNRFHDTEIVYDIFFRNQIKKSCKTMSGYFSKVHEDGLINIYSANQFVMSLDVVYNKKEQQQFFTIKSFNNSKFVLNEDYLISFEVLRINGQLYGEICAIMNIRNKYLNKWSLDKFYSLTKLPKYDLYGPLSYYAISIRIFDISKHFKVLIKIYSLLSWLEDFVDFHPSEDIINDVWFYHGINKRLDRSIMVFSDIGYKDVMFLKDIGLEFYCYTTKDELVDKCKELNTIYDFCLSNTWGVVHRR